MALKRNWTNASFHSNIPRVMTKETVKALVVIIAALGVLVLLLLWANHLRPPGIKTGKAGDVPSEHFVSTMAVFS